MKGCTLGQALDPEPLEAVPSRPKGRGILPYVLSTHSEMGPTYWFHFSHSFENKKTAACKNKRQSFMIKPEFHRHLVKVFIVCVRKSSEETEKCL